MTSHDNISGGLRFAAESNFLGYAAFDGEFRVRERLGALSNWLPGPGESATGGGVLFALEDALNEARRDGAPLVLPSVSLDDRQINISIAWSADEQVYVAMSTPDESSKDWPRWTKSETRSSIR